jgi:hypothetical protein
VASVSLPGPAHAPQVLASLSRLVQELPNLEMPDLIGTQVRCGGAHVGGMQSLGSP